MFSLNQDQFKILQNFAGSIGSNKEFEIRFGKFIWNKDTKTRRFESSVDINFFYDLKRSLDEQSGTVSSTQISTEYIFENEKTRIKKIIKEDGSISYMSKNTLKKYDIFDYDLRLSLASEIPVDASSITESTIISAIRKKYRTVYDMLGCGHLDLTIVEQSTGPNEKAVLKYEIELEINKKDSINSILSILQIVLQTKQQNFYVISNYEKREILNQYKNLIQSHYFVGAQPETLQKNQLTTLYKNLYSVTDKADGERVFMFIDNNKNVFLIDNNMNNVMKTNQTSKGYYSCLIDGELLRIDNKIVFMAFDLLAYNGKDIRGNDKYLLKQRLDRLHHIISSTALQNNFYEFKMKKFYYKNVFIASEVILEKVKQNKYGNDGLIYTPMNEPYPITKKWTSLLKWKPAELNTIDFYSIQENGWWNLYVQHFAENNENKKIELTLFDVSKLCKEPVETYSGVTFRTSFPDTLIDPTTNQPFKSNTVIEFKWDKHNGKFIPIRTRWDKTSNPKKHGNFSAVACDIWNNIHNPIEPEQLFKFTTPNEPKDFFFEKMRKYHNKVKEMLYNKYCNQTEYLLELCSGRGGDLYKWMHNGVKNVIGFDISEKNIKECQKRVETTFENKKLNYNFTQMDLCEPKSKDIITLNYPNSFSVANCHFAVHYFFKSESTMDNLIQILDSCLIDNGLFIVTFMDKVKVDKLIGHGNTVQFKEVDNEISYFLKKQNNKNQYFGNKLKITLNGNNILGEGSDEFIVDFDFFTSYMTKRGYNVIDSKLFEEINGIGKTSDMTESEKDISHLNRYCVFQKTKKESKSVVVPKQTIVQQKPKKQLFKFDSIELEKIGINLFMVQTNYDIINLINCIDYKYYKNINICTQLNSFDDIVSTFNDYNIYPAKPVFIDLESVYSGFDYVEGHLYFTYHKHVVDKKLDEDVVEYHNWYLVTFKNKIYFKQPKAKLVIRNNSQCQESLNENLIKNNSQCQESLNENLIKNNSQCQESFDDKQVDYESIYKECQSKITIKRLKEILGNYNLKVSGNKDELLDRLKLYCESKRIQIP